MENRFQSRTPTRENTLSEYLCEESWCASSDDCVAMFCTLHGIVEHSTS